MQKTENPDTRLSGLETVKEWPKQRTLSCKKPINYSLKSIIVQSFYNNLVNLQDHPVLNSVQVENKESFVATVSLNEDGHPVSMKLIIMANQVNLL